MLLHSPNERRALRRRRTLAAGLEHAVGRAQRPPYGFSAEIPVDRVAVAGNSERLLAIAGVLRSERAVPDQGIAAARRLLTDGASPLYVRGERLAPTLTAIEIVMGLH